MMALIPESPATKLKSTRVAATKISEMKHSLMLLMT